MKPLLAAFAILVCTAIGDAQAPKSAPAQTPPTPTPVTKVTYFPHDTVSAALAKGGPLVTAPDVIVQGSHRDVAGQVEVHDKEMDVIFVTDGGATFVTGGTMTGRRGTRPGQWLADSIAGGETFHLTKGDVIVVPAGTPHWFKEVAPPVSYFVVKVVKP